MEGFLKFLENFENCPGGNSKGISKEHLDNNCWNAPELLLEAPEKNTMKIFVKYPKDRLKNFLKQLLQEHPKELCIEAFTEIIPEYISKRTPGEIFEHIKKFL